MPSIQIRVQPVYTMKEYGNSFDFFDDVHGWAIGAYRIVETLDGGESWIDRNENFPGGDLRRVVALGPHSCCLLSSAFTSPVICSSTRNSGKSWHRSVIPQTDLPQDMSFTRDHRHGFFVTKGHEFSPGICTTSDGGVTWNSKPFPHPFPAIIECLDDAHCWVVSKRPGRTKPVYLLVPDGSERTYSLGGEHNDLLFSSDGGNSWLVLHTFDADVSMLYAVSDRLLFAVGYEGYIGISDDGGLTWRRVDLEIETGVETVACRGDIAIAGGVDGMAAVSLDRGQSWVRADIAVNDCINSIALTSERSGVMLLSNQIFRFELDT